MKIGTKVKVVANIHGHDFDVGEKVEYIGKSEYDDGMLKFKATDDEIWYMGEEEFEIIQEDFSNVINVTQETSKAISKRGRDHIVESYYKKEFEKSEEKYQELLIEYWDNVNIHTKVFEYLLDKGYVEEVKDGDWEVAAEILSMQLKILRRR